MGLVRSQVLLEQDQLEKLRAIAASEGRSLSDVVREMVDLQLRRRTYAAMAEAASRLAEDYAAGDDLTALTALDSEDFFDA